MNGNIPDWIEDLSLDDLRYVVGTAAERVSEDLAVVEGAHSYLQSRREDAIPLTWSLGQELKYALAEACTASPELEAELRRSHEDRCASKDELIVADAAAVASIVIGVAGIAATFLAAKIYAPSCTQASPPAGEDVIKTLIDRIELLEKKFGVANGESQSSE